MTRLLAVLLLCSTAYAMPVLNQEQRDEATNAYTRGREAFGAGLYTEAAQQFEHAYRVSGHPAVIYNMAQAYRLGGKHAKALELYREFVLHQDTVPEQVEDAKLHILALTKLFAEKAEAAAREAAASKAYQDIREAQRLRYMKAGPLEQPRPRLDVGGYVLLSLGALGMVGGGVGIAESQTTWGSVGIGVGAAVMTTGVVMAIVGAKWKRLDRAHGLRF